MKNQNQLEQSLNITWQVENEELCKSETLTFNHSLHSFTRAQERNIYNENISVVIEYGKEFFKQGLIFYVLGENKLPNFLTAVEKRIYKNTVVVVAGDSNTIITCYHSKNPYKHIRKKTKTLSVQYNLS